MKTHGWDHSLRQRGKVLSPGHVCEPAERRVEEVGQLMRKTMQGLRDLRRPSASTLEKRRTLEGPERSKYGPMGKPPPWTHPRRKTERASGDLCSESLEGGSGGEQKPAFGFGYRNMNQGNFESTLSNLPTGKKLTIIEKGRSREFSK